MQLFNSEKVIMIRVKLPNDRAVLYSRYSRQLLATPMGVKSGKSGLIDHTLDLPSGDVQVSDILTLPTNVIEISYKTDHSYFNY